MACTQCGTLRYVTSGRWRRRGKSQQCTQWGTLIHVLSGRWGRRGGSQPCMQSGTLNDTSLVGDGGEEWGISVMYIAGHTQ